MGELKKLNLAAIDWPNVFPHYIDSRFLNGKGRWWTCPLCDGEETFRLYPAEKDPRGGWHCARCLKGGTGVQLIHEVTGKPYREIYYELGTGSYNGGIPVAVVRKAKPVPVRTEKSDEQKCREMQAAWDGAAPVTVDSPVWTYLSTRIPGLRLEWIGRDVRCHPGLEYVDAFGKKQGKFPVMLQRARSQTGKPRRVHRTYLTADGQKVPFLTKNGKPRAKLEMSAPAGSFGSSVRLNTTRSRTLALVEGNELRTSLDVLERDGQAEQQRLLQRATAIRNTIASHASVVGQRESILGAAADRDGAQLRLGKAEALIEPLQRAIDELDAKRLRAATVGSTLSSLQSEGTTKADLIKTLTEQSAVIGSVPCAGMDIHVTCPLLAQARSAAQQVDVQTISLNDLRTRYRGHKAELEQLAPAVEALSAKRAELQRVNAEITAARQALQRATELAARKPLLDAAETGMQQGQAELASLDVERGEASKRREIETARLTGLLREVEAEVSRLASVDVAQAIADVDLQLAARRETCTGLDARIEALIRSQATGEMTLVTLERELEGFSATQALAERISDEIAKWKLLGKGLGNDGVIALTIDDAGPALTQTVNDLLLACYGTRFTVEIQTQRTLANGDTREGFEILVHDAESDSSKAVGVMSGGQKVWINECLTRGVALYIAGNAGQPYETLFSDESDGPLDPDRKVQFMRMKREVLRQGGYAREFFISQTPDLIAEADAVIDVAALAR
ncbi:nuclease SbcCD subunit C [Burkholderia cepacia]|uniref:Nuclease SbcCD subunit C n=1 Tax=Burkholderia cepacia TaxID=292 RepID=A0A2S8HZJ4_BURCE|nr:nuclease SbcCD subunit C [Burkholderia cepacia]PQP07849.1 nuclease SbcCD subunit C [Burkholderia cepacia]